MYRYYRINWLFTRTSPGIPDFTCRVFLTVMPSGLVQAVTRKTDGTLIVAEAGMLMTYDYMDRYGHTKQGYYVRCGDKTLDSERRSRHAAHRLADYVISRSK